MSTTPCQDNVIFLFNVRKLLQVIMIVQRSKLLNETTSYRPISLLPLMSTIFEWKAILTEGHVPFRRPIQRETFCHTTVSRIVMKIIEGLEQKMCTSTVLDMQQAFDIKCRSTESCANQKYIFHNKYTSYYNHTEQHLKNCIRLYLIKFRILHASILGPFLYLLNTADMPVTIDNILTQQFIIPQYPSVDSTNLQTHLNLLQK